MNYFDDIKITSVDRVVTTASKPSPPKEYHHFYGIGMMLGKEYVCRTVYPNTKYLIKMPFLYLIHPDFRSSWQTVNNNLRENRWLVFEGARGVRMVESLFEHTSICSSIIQLKNFSELITIHQKMLHLFQSGIPSRNHQLAVCAENFMGAIYNALNAPEIKTPIMQILSDLIREITEEPGKDYNFKKIAEKHKISYYHFRRCFVQYTQIPIHEFLLQKRFALAISLLQTGENSVKEIADRCGFHNSSDFSRFIKERAGTTPSELRKQNLFPEI